jgi:polysaccharide deacetylase family protein (PEP-CTERM system associated)
MINALTVDVEDYFQVTAFANSIKVKDWDIYPSRVRDNTIKVLDILDTFSVKATFFVLGWIADKFPSLVKEIHERGHEIASHGYDHQLVYDAGPDKFKDDIRRSKRLLEDICGVKVVGYRAPSYSITKKSLWALDILIAEGFLYDSSVFPVAHDIYGIPDAGRFLYDIQRPSGTIKEFPLSTIEIKCGGFKYRIPVAGGGYLRLFPLWMTKKAINTLNVKEHQPAVLYFHPWEIDLKQPRIRAGIKSRLRHYTNLSKTEDRIKNILSSFKFAPMRNILGI